MQTTRPHVVAAAAAVAWVLAASAPALAEPLLATAPSALAPGETAAGETAAGAPANQPAGQVGGAVSVDRGAQEEPPATNEPAPRSRWKNSVLGLDQSLTTHTVGVGQDYQSYNPTYDWVLWLAPRYYLLDEPDLKSHVRAVAGVAQEVTDSDTATRKRQLDALDSQLSLRTALTLAKRDGFGTIVDVGLPELLLPTSRASFNNGTLLGLGLGLYPIQTGPLRGSDAAFLHEFLLRGTLRYRYTFARANVGVNDDISRPRTDINGRPVLSDQLDGSALIQHQLRLGGIASLQLTERMSWQTIVEWRPSWRYRLRRDVCVRVPTGCGEIDSVDNPQRFSVTTVFTTGVEVELLDEMAVSLGYENVANQLGPDGRRRNVLYSPNARFALSLTGYLEPIFSPSAGAPSEYEKVARGAGAMTF